MGQHNGFGINGATPNAHLYTYSVYNDSGSNSDPGRTLGVARAIEDANVGDIIILELQDRGLDQSNYPDYGPADIKVAIWDLVKAATSDSILVVAAAMGLVQSWAKKNLNRYLGPYEMRELLVSTGTPHTGDKDIGPLPNVEAAIKKLSAVSISTKLNKGIGKQSEVKLISSENGRLFLSFPKKGNYSISLYSTKGSLITSLNRHFNGGVAQVAVNKKISSGVYILRIHGNLMNSKIKCRL